MHESGKISKALRAAINDFKQGKDNERKSLESRLDESVDNRTDLGEIDPTTVSTHPGEIDPTTGSSKYSEANYQRCFLNSGEHFNIKPGNRLATFLDGELPVVFGGKARRKSVDLVGTIDGNPFICELKYANPESSYESNSPAFALLEVATYYYQIIKNREQLSRQGIRHENMQLPADFWTRAGCNAALIVLGNGSYWDRWDGRDGMIDQGLIRRIKQCFGDDSPDVYCWEGAEFERLEEVKVKGRYKGELKSYDINVRHPAGS